MSDPYEMSARDLIGVLQRNGFQACGLAACNCGSWHQVTGWPERFAEINDIIDPNNGETLLTAVQRKLDRIEELERWASVEVVNWRRQITERDKRIKKLEEQLAESEEESMELQRIALDGK
jgi:hypothetical protein